MALPFLPGNSFNQRLGKNKFHKSHHFDMNNEVAMLVGGETKPGIGGDPLRGQRLKPVNSTYPCGAGSKLPAWVAFDRQVLCFDAYFQEAVDEKREEQFRIRNCKIYFYLEDDSIQVIEPRIKNAGIPQGTLIRRHRIPRSPPNDEEFYNVEDFNIGKEICLYSRVFKLTGCDEFTQNFLCKLGVRVNQPDGAPVDPYMGYRKAMDESMQPLRPYEKHDTLKQFLDHDRHVLRFYCFWDDSDNMFGDPREMVLHYFLADDTIEIRECIPANSGRDAAPMFLRRQRLPKDIVPLNQPGVATDRTVLNVFGPTGHGGRYILDSLKTGAVHHEYYTDSDLTIGSCLNVWGRKFILCDCDTFTQEYYKTKYGIEDFTPVRYKSQDSSAKSQQWPPYNGFGSEEDSLCSCMGLIPKPPRRDFIKFMEKDRHGLDSNVLRYLAKMETTKPIDADRRFIISYFLSDDTILVFEPPVRNSGIIGGKFLERGRVKKPMQQRYSTDLSEYYSASDLFVGAGVDFNCHRFNIIDADEYAFRYMEKCAGEYPKANIQVILQTLAALANQKKDEVKSFFMRNDPNGSGILMYEQFHNLIKQLAPQLTEHEIMTIARYYGDDAEQNAQIDIKTLISIVQEQLRKNNFEGFVKLSENFQHMDNSRCGVLDADTVRKVCHALHVPIADDMLRALLVKMVSNDQGHIDYESFIKNLNWRDCPVAPMSAQGVRFDEGWAGNQAKDQITQVRYQVLLDDILGGSE
ncbi:EF-hand domain-containing family member C2-like [Lineus longissimus]|uniref:EF-hand domain-containing family member C2-like n=1 Tax=Lineus longissimus TaxID=88925 RepID=UPI002B4EDCA8